VDARYGLGGSRHLEDIVGGQGDSTLEDTPLGGSSLGSFRVFLVLCTPVMQTELRGVHTRYPTPEPTVGRGLTPCHLAALYGVTLSLASVLHPLSLSLCLVRAICYSACLALMDA
jgi:hypothetical protein